MHLLEMTPACSHEDLQPNQKPASEGQQQPSLSDQVSMGESTPKDGAANRRATG
jgi:hypothetical protein